MKSSVSNKNKKNALGRGLGTLLGGELDGEKIKTKPPAQISQVSKKIEFSSNNSMVEEKKVAVPEPAPQPPVVENAYSSDSLENRVIEIDIERVFANEEQPRKIFDKAALQTLADSIKEQGLLQPITVKRAAGNQFEIIAGERRWRATQLAGLHKVPAIVKKVTEQKTLELALIENIQREDLNPIEEATAYKHLMDKYDLTQAELAKKMGKERATIANLLRLLNLGPEVREMVSANEISMGQAKLLLSVDDFRMQFKIARKIIKNKLTVRQVEKLIKKLHNKEEDSQNTTPAVSLSHINNLKSEIQKLLGTKVDLAYREGKSKLQIQFYSDDELNSFIDKLRKS